jgi:hypothetical protein
MCVFVPSVCLQAGLAAKEEELQQLTTELEQEKKVGVCRGGGGGGDAPYSSACLSSNTPLVCAQRSP